MQNNFKRTAYQVLHRKQSRFGIFREFLKINILVCSRGGVENTRLEAKAKVEDTKKIRGQGQPYQGQTLSRPRTGIIEAKDQGHRRKRSQKEKVFKNFFQAISKKKGLRINFSGNLQNFTIQK